MFNGLSGRDDEAYELPSYVFLEFLLLFMARLNELEVCRAAHWDDQAKWFTNLAENAAHFSHLETIRIHGPLRIENIIPLLAGPALRTLELVKVNCQRSRQVDDAFAAPNPTFVELLMGPGNERSSGIETLYFSDSWLEPRQVGAVLWRIRGLKSLIYKHGILDEMGSEPPAPFPRDTYRIFQLMLIPHSATLTHLRFHTQDPLPADRVNTIFSVLRSLETLDVGPIEVEHRPETGLELHCEPLRLALHPPNIRNFKANFRSDGPIHNNSFAQDFATAFAKIVAGNSIEEVAVTYDDVPFVEAPRAGMAVRYEKALTQDVKDAVEIEMEKLGIKLLS